MVEGGGPHLTQVALNAEVGLTHRWSLRLNLPAQGGTGTGWSPWDAVVGASYRPIDRPDLSLSLRPGLTLPVGPSDPTASFVPGTTGSPDPWLAAALFAGERWLFARAEGDALTDLAMRAALRVVDDGKAIQHSIRLLVLDAKGRLIERYDDNNWPLERVVEQLRTGGPLAPPGTSGTVTPR